MRPYNSKLGLEVNDFLVIEDLGRKLPNEDSKSKAAFVVVECKYCKEKLQGQFTHFKYGSRKCLKCFPKKWKIKKDYTGEILGEFEIVKDLLVKEKRKHRKVIGKCIKCLKECEHNYYSFKFLKVSCECKYELQKTEKWVRIRKIYLGILYRCYSKNSKDYERYGARGITVCDKWRVSTYAFYEWAVRNGYERHLTVDRIDNEQGYSPENCRWVDLKEQARNKRNVMKKDDAIEIKKLLSLGKTHQEIAKITGLSHHSVSNISKGSTWVDV